MNRRMNTPAWLKGKDQMSKGRVTIKNPDGSVTYSRDNERRVIRSNGKVYQMPPNSTTTINTPTPPAGEPAFMTAMRSFMEKFKKKPAQPSASGIAGTRG